METPPLTPGSGLSLRFAFPELYSKKVFVGGLPPDIDEEEITNFFNAFGPLYVDWPYKSKTLSYFPPNGFAFIIYQNELSVQKLVKSCYQNGEKLFMFISSSSVKNKLIQIRPWLLADSDFVLDHSLPVDPRMTVFVGGVPRPLKASELAVIMETKYGGVRYVGIDIDPQFKYPKGAGRVAFCNRRSFANAIFHRYIDIQYGSGKKRVEVKPYLLENQACDECQGLFSEIPYAEYFCGDVNCLQYYCSHCWLTIHSRPRMQLHVPIPRRGA